MLSKIKICGITRESDGDLAFKLGAWAIGFIFYSKSKRYIEPSKAKEIVQNLSNKYGDKPIFIGVFVDEELEKVHEIAQEVGLSYGQFHGDESISYIQKIKIPKIKSFRVGKDFSIESVKKYSEIADLILFDSFDVNQYGGSGKSFDWNIAQRVSNSADIILAGGIQSSNIREAIEKVNPYAIDLSSSIEDEPGIKSEDKMKTLFNQLKVDQYG